ncbi:bcl-2-binding component 3 isoform X3 [Onychomys torridus]|uniref:bcl-2-binding component 3 isoform X3 n=1 Tax=Onychomys torridus TaxID=38674 RepID=UPI00167FCE3B|nr:bcl-2-binding component 3 isoform X3 [Onychomys torridus]
MPHPGVWPHCGWAGVSWRPEGSRWVGSVAVSPGDLGHCSGWDLSFPACHLERARADGPQPSLSPAQQHLESPVPSAPEALAGGPTQAAPGVRGEEEEWAREIGAQLRRMADDLNAQYERRRQEERHRHRPSPWRVMYNLFMGLLPLPRDPGAPEMEPN